MTKEAGILSKPNPATDLTKPRTTVRPAPVFSTYDNDGKIDIFLTDNGAQGGMSLYHNLGNGKFEDVTKQAGLDPLCMESAAQRATTTMMVLSILPLASGRACFFCTTKRTEPSKMSAAGAGIKEVGVDGLTFIDYDHDGDLDLTYAASGMKMIVGPSQKSGTSAMWRNNGNGTFTNVDRSVVDLRLPRRNAIGTDYNNDRAVDLVVADWMGATVFRESARGEICCAAPLLDAPANEANSLHPNPSDIPTVGITVLDFDHDGWMDIALTRIDSACTHAVAQQPRQELRTGEAS